MRRTAVQRSRNQQSGSHRARDSPSANASAEKPATAKIKELLLFVPKSILVMFHNLASVMLMGYANGFMEPLWDTAVFEISGLVWFVAMLLMAVPAVILGSTIPGIAPYTASTHLTMLAVYLLNLVIVVFVFLWRASQEPTFRCTEDLGGKLRRRERHKWCCRCWPDWLDFDNTVGIALSVWDYYQVIWRSCPFSLTCENNRVYVHIYDTIETCM
jgi:hypothetical protein